MSRESSYARVPHHLQAIVSGAVAAAVGSRFELAPLSKYPPTLRPHGKHMRLVRPKGTLFDQGPGSATQQPAGATLLGRQQETSHLLRIMRTAQQTVRKSYRVCLQWCHAVVSCYYDCLSS